MDMRPRWTSQCPTPPTPVQSCTYVAAVVNPNLDQFPILQVHDAVVGKLPVPILVELYPAGDTL